MMTSATKSEEKRRDWSVQRGVDHNKIRVNQAVETRNRAQFLGQVPKQQRKSYRRLARGTKHRQHARKGILLGECRLKQLEVGRKGRQVEDPFLGANAAAALGQHIQIDPGPESNTPAMAATFSGFKHRTPPKLHLI